MHHLNFDKAVGLKKHSRDVLHPETSVLTGLRMQIIHSRVMAANYLSSLVMPGDLDAFLKGDLRTC